MNQKADELEKFDFVHEERIPEEIGVLFWDVNGTITFEERLDEEVANFIIELAKRGIYHIFITGRDRFWLIEFLVEPLKKLAGDDAEKIFGKMRFYPELGLMSLDPLSGEPAIFEEIQRHALTGSNLRERVATLFWQTNNLQPFKEGEKVQPRRYIGKDANGKPYLLPIIPEEVDIAVRLPDFIWSDTKELIGTAEVIRDARQRIPNKRGGKILLAAQIVENFLNYWEIKDIKVSPLTTAINIVPILDGVGLDKNWAAGRVLKDLSQEGEQDVGQIARKSLAIGDSKGDFLFTQPYLSPGQTSQIIMVFVGPTEGPKNQYKPTPEQEVNVFAKSRGENQGPVVTLAVLQWLERKKRFKSL